MTETPDIDQIVLNRLCHILARDIYFHHQPITAGHTKQSDALQTALVEYLSHYDPK